MKKKRFVSILLCTVMVLSLTGCKSGDYKSAAELTESGDWQAARDIYASLEDYKDSADLVTECDYQLASEAAAAGKYGDALTAFKALGDYKDSADLVTECDYQLASEAMAAGKYGDAFTAFKALGDYKDSADMVTECSYQLALADMTAGKYDEAIAAFETLGEYKDSADRLPECHYEKASTMLGSGDYAGAEEIFAGLGLYKDSQDMVRECQYQTALAYYEDGKYEEAIQIFFGLVDYKETDHYTVLSMLRYDQQQFVDIMVQGIENKFAAQGVPVEMEETTSRTPDGGRTFFVDYIPEQMRVMLTFQHSDGKGKTYSTGQINYMSVFAECYNANMLDTIASEYLLTSGLLMETLVDGTDPAEFITLMGEKMDELEDTSTETVSSMAKDFDYDCYKCRISVTAFEDDITRLIFSVTVPELVED